MLRLRNSGVSRQSSMLSCQSSSRCFPASRNCVSTSPICSSGRSSIRRRMVVTSMSSSGSVSSGARCQPEARNCFHASSTLHGDTSVRKSNSDSVLASMSSHLRQAPPSPVVFIGPLPLQGRTRPVHAQCRSDRHHCQSHASHQRARLIAGNAQDRDGIRAGADPSRSDCR